MFAELGLNINEKLKTTYLIMEIGLKYTKVGFSGESIPRKILPTPNLFDVEAFYKDKSNKNVLFYRKPMQDVKHKIAEFIQELLNNVLGIKRSNRESSYIAVLLFDFSLLPSFRPTFQKFVEILLSYPSIGGVKILQNNLAALFCTGLSSGIYIDCGFSASKISVLNGGNLIFSKEIPVGSSLLQKELRRGILEDEEATKGLSEEEKGRLEEGIGEWMEDILVKVGLVAGKEVMAMLEEVKPDDKRFYGPEAYTTISNYHNLPTFKVSFINRLLMGEIIFDKNNENNLAYHLLKILSENVPCEIRKNVASNIVLGGGVSMLLGFTQRFEGEVKSLVQDKEFVNLSQVKSSIRIHKQILPRNCLNWIGVSLCLNFDFLKLNFAGREITKDQNDYLDKEIKEIFMHFSDEILPKKDEGKIEEDEEADDDFLDEYMTEERRETLLRKRTMGKGSVSKSEETNKELHGVSDIKEIKEEESKVTTTENDDKAEEKKSS